LQRKFLERKTCQSASSLKVFIKHCPLEFFMQPKTEFSVSFSLQKLLKKHLHDGFPILEDAAATLHMTKRTLIRKLKEEGTSYQQIKDLVRRDRAIYLLTNHMMPLSEIATAVGFSDPTVFARAFKNWIGVSPREYRAEIAGDDNAAIRCL
jgi:AraC-like DNA-binding protein